MVNVEGSTSPCWVYSETAAYYKQTRASLQHLVHTMHDCKGGNYHLKEENEIRRVVQKCQSTDFKNTVHQGFNQFRSIHSKTSMFSKRTSNNKYNWSVLFWNVKAYQIRTTNFTLRPAFHAPSKKKIERIHIYRACHPLHARHDLLSPSNIVNKHPTFVFNCRTCCDHISLSRQPLALMKFQ